jgi:ribosomal protein S27AE
LVFDTQGFKLRATELRRNPRCRFAHPLPIQVTEFVPSNAPVSQVFAMTDKDAALSVVGAGDFVRKTECRVCGSHRLWALANRLLCGGCHLAVHVKGSERMPQVREADLTAPLLARPLTRFGIRNGDILRLSGSSGEIHIQIGAAHA